MVLKARDRNADSPFESLGRLDALLVDAVERAQAEFGPDARADPFRGLHISLPEVDELLTREPGAPLPKSASRQNGGPPKSGPLAELAREHSLTAFDADALLLALAPEVDLRYQRVYAYLQDDVTRKRPSVDLALNVLCATREEKLAQRTRFLPGAPLRDRRLVQVVPPSEEPAPLLAHFMAVDPQIVRELLGGEGLDPRLTRFCRLETVAEEEPVWLPEAVAGARIERGLHLHGAPRSDRLAVARGIAGEAGVPLLAADLARVAATGAGASELIALSLREARLQGALLYLDPLDALALDHPLALDALYEAWRAHRGAVVSGGEREWNAFRRGGAGPPGVRGVHLRPPQAAERREIWSRELAQAGVRLEDRGVDALAARFHLFPTQVHAAVARSPGGGPAELFAAAREQTGGELGALAVKVEPARGWDDIVLPRELEEQLREVVSRAANREQVMAEWGFAAKLPRGSGLTALFAGPSGTGKTLAAEVVAHELGLDLYELNLAGVVSKWVGETEKNVDRVFDAARDADAVLVLNEAEALLGTRSRGRDALDRYSNMELAYLLQKMEAFDGIAILTTNLGENLDQAFTRRLAFTLHFPLPGEAERRRLWQLVWPDSTPRAPDLDLASLAERFRLTGGGIRNAALAAAFLAAPSGGPVSQHHVLKAVEREFAKLGKVLSADDLAG